MFFSSRPHLAFHSYLLVSMKFFGKLFFLFLFLSFFSCKSVYAETQRPIPSGLRLEWGSVAERATPSSLRFNGAALAFLDSWSLQLLHTGLRFPWSSISLQDRDERALSETSFGDGLGVFLAFKTLPMLTTGLGAQFLYTTLPDRMGQQIDGHLRLSIAESFRWKRWLALGVTWHAFLSPNATLNALWSFDIGLIWRPWNFISFGLSLRDVASPASKDLVLPRRWNIGVALRPFLNDRLVFSSDLSFEERTDLWHFSYKIVAEPFQGLLVGLQFRHGEASRGMAVGAFVGLRLGQWSVGQYVKVGLNGVPLEKVLLGSMTTSLLYSQKPYHPLFQPSGRVPLIDIAGNLPERERGIAFQSGQPTFLNLLSLLYRMARDKSVMAVLLRIGDMSCGYGKLEEVRKAIQEIRRHGKKVFVYVNSITLKSYYLASVADDIFINPVGSIWINGLASQVIFWADFLKKYGIRAQYIKFGQYKTYPNSYTHNHFTQAHRKMYRRLLNVLFEHLVAMLAKGRKRQKKVVQDWFKQGTFSAREAKAKGLVDAVFYWDQIMEHLPKYLKTRRFHLDLGYRHRHYYSRRWLNYPQIAVIYVDGAIISGKNIDDPLFGVHFSGAQTIVRMLSKARRDPNIKAVVLRINSPGGEVLAADTIWRYVWILSRFKPVVVSMGDVAASGGYYIAAPAHRILASSMTLTGSIGIFAGKFDFSGLLKRLQIKVGLLKRGMLANIFSPLRPFDRAQYKALRRSILFNYNAFLKKVAEGRRLPLKLVKRNAEGLVLRAEDAKKVGLIDKIGGLWASIQEAKQLANIPRHAQVELLTLPQRPRWQISLNHIIGGIHSRQNQKAQMLSEIFGFYRQFFLSLQKAKLWALAFPFSD